MAAPLKNKDVKSSFIDRPKLLIVEDEDAIITQMKWSLSKDYSVLLSGNFDEAIELFIKERPPVVTLDLGLPPAPDTPETGFRCLEEFLQIDPLTKVMVITGNDERENAIEAISRGAHDFFTKPVEIDELRIALKRAFYIYSLEKEVLQLHKKVLTEPLDGIIGTSPVMESVFSAIRKVATTDVPVLITGESGTGKEIIAKSIHELSERKGQPFIPINCGAIPEGLLESELFGHEKGAFTGAYYQKRGKFEMADKGTIFLDEIGELVPSLQVKILRFLQEHKLERIGGSKPITLDVRVIAATNRDLKDSINSGLFREDLYYRLSVVNIELPPLRERGDDLFQIANTVLWAFANKQRKQVKGFSKEAIEAMKAYPWPGNVRELENKIKRAVIMTEEEYITPDDLRLTIPVENERLETLNLNVARERIEKEYTTKALKKHNWNIVKASEELDISRQHLYNLIKKYGLKR